MFLTEIDLSKWIVASGVLIVLLFLFAYAVRYVAHKQPQTAFGMKRKRLKLVETLHLDARNKICIVDMDETAIILAVGANGTEMIGTQEKPIAEEEPEGDSAAAGIGPLHKLEGIGFLKRFINTANPLEKESNPKSTSKNKKVAQ
ncbi:MAG: flagellar biogenesis protein FliO [Alphaproteobacteria bacterium]|jgi:flagellar biogenesis protein FliO